MSTSMPPWSSTGTTASKATSSACHASKRSKARPGGPSMLASTDVTESMTARSCNRNVCETQRLPALAERSCHESGGSVADSCSRLRVVRQLSP